jgi:CRISPR-associated protein Csb3
MERSKAKFHFQTSFRLQDCIGVLTAASVKTPQDEAIAPAIAPLDICTEWGTISLNWWLNHTLTDRSELKTWAGYVTSKKLVEDAISKLPRSKEIDESILESYTQPMDSRFGFDARATKTPREYGFSPDGAGTKFYTSPAVELLAAIGLQTFRPKRRGNDFEYELWGWPFPLPVARLACACLLPFGRIAKFKTGFVKRGSAKGFKSAEEVPSE